MSEGNDIFSDRDRHETRHSQQSGIENILRKPWPGPFLWGCHSSRAAQGEWPGGFNYCFVMKKRLILKTSTSTLLWNFTVLDQEWKCVIIQLSGLKSKSYTFHGSV